MVDDIGVYLTCVVYESFPNTHKGQGGGPDTEVVELIGIIIPRDQN